MAFMDRFKRTVESEMREELRIAKLELLKAERGVEDATAYRDSLKNRVDRLTQDVDQAEHPPTYSTVAADVRSVMTALQAA